MSLRLLPLLIMLLWLLPSWSSASIFSATGKTYSTAFDIGAPYNIVEIRNSQFTANGGYNINLGAMTTAAYPVWITFCNCAFSNGASLYIKANSADTPTDKPVYINFIDCTWTDAGLAFWGHFPHRTQITMSRNVVRINQRLTALGGISPGPNGDGRMAYCIVFSDFHLYDHSYFVMDKGDVGGTWDTTGSSGTSAHAMFPITAYNIYVTGYSAWILQNSKVKHSFAFHSETVTRFLDHSVFAFRSLLMTCDRFCISFQHGGGGSVVFQTQSVFLIDRVNASVPASTEGEDLLYVGSDAFTFSSQSVFLVTNNILSPYRYTFSIPNTATLDNSYAVFSDNSLKGTAFRVTFGMPNGGGIIVQCNDISGATLRTAAEYKAIGLTTGPTTLYDCPRGDTLCYNQNAACFSPLATGMTSSCECQCATAGVGPMCLPIIFPIIKDECIVTVTERLTNSHALTLTQRLSPTKTEAVVSKTVLSSETKTITVSQMLSETISWNGTITRNLKVISRTHQPSFSRTHLETEERTQTSTLSMPSSKTVSGSITTTTSLIMTLSTRLSATRSIQLTVTSSPTHSRTDEFSASDSQTEPISSTGSMTTSLTVSPSASVSLSQMDSKSRSQSVSITVTLTVPPAITDTINPISLTWPDTPTRTFIDTETHTETPSLTSSRSPSSSATQSATLSSSGTTSITRTFTSTVELTETRTVTATLSTSSSPSLTMSLPITGTRSRTITSTRSDCDWFQLALVPTSPMEIVDVGNNSMSVDYLTALENGENFTLYGLGQWYVTQTSFVGEASSVNTSTYINAPSATFTVGQIPSVYNPETTRDVVIEVTFRCGVFNHREFYTIDIQPLAPILSAAQLDMLIKLTSLASVLTVSPSAAAAAALSLILEQIMLCKPLYENKAISLMGLVIGTDDARYLRGALVTNGLVILGEAFIVSSLAIGIIVFSKNRPTPVRFWRTMEMLQWPNVMHISVSALLQLSTTAAVGLISIASTVPDGVLALIGIGFCFSYTVWICRQVYNMFKLENSSSRKWNVAQGLGTTGFVFGDYSKPWFVGAECIAYFLIGVVAGIPPTLQICLIQLFFITICALILLIVLGVFRPYKTYIGLGFALAVWTLIFTAGLSLVIGHYSRNPKASYGVASICLLLIPVFALLRGLWDIYSILKYAKGWWGRVTSAECLQDLPWDGEDEELEVVSSEDDELLNYGVAAPLEVPLLQADAKAEPDIPMLPPPPKEKKKIIVKKKAPPPETVPVDENDILLNVAKADGTNTSVVAKKEEGGAAPQARQCDPEELDDFIKGLGGV